MAVVGSNRNPAATHPNNITVPNTEEEDEFDANGARIMTPRVLHRLCRARGHYLTPACNTSLYLQDMQFRRIENLQDFVSCRVLHLSNNCLTRIEGLQHMTGLQALYLQSNDLRSLDGLSGLPALHTLHVSNNPLGCLLGLPPSLRTLHAANTGLTGAASLASLSSACPDLEVLDVSSNGGLGAGQLGPSVLEVLARTVSLRVLYTTQTPLQQIPNLRRLLVSALPRLTYLDAGPVDECDRRGCEAWRLGGVAAEKAARLAYRAERRAAAKRSTLTFATERARRAALRELQMPGDASATDILLDQRHLDATTAPTASQVTESGAPALPHTPAVALLLRRHRRLMDAEATAAAAAAAAAGDLTASGDGGGGDGNGSVVLHGIEAVNNDGGARFWGRHLVVDGSSDGEQQEMTFSFLVDDLPLVRFGGISVGCAEASEVCEEGAVQDGGEREGKGAGEGPEEGEGPSSSMSGCVGGGEAEGRKGCRATWKEGNDKEGGREEEEEEEGEDKDDGRGDEDDTAVVGRGRVGGDGAAVYGGEEGGGGSQDGEEEEEGGEEEDGERGQEQTSLHQHHHQEQRRPQRPIVPWRASGLSECAVCSEAFVNRELLALLPCQHFFHDRCIRRWLLGFSATCPMCRAPVWPLRPPPPPPSPLPMHQPPPAPSPPHHEGADVGTIGPPHAGPVHVEHIGMMTAGAAATNTEGTTTTNMLMGDAAQGTTPTSVCEAHGRGAVTEGDNAPEEVSSAGTSDPDELVPPAANTASLPGLKLTPAPESARVVAPAVGPVRGGAEEGAPAGLADQGGWYPAGGRAALTHPRRSGREAECGEVGFGLGFMERTSSVGGCWDPSGSGNGSGAVGGGGDSGGCSPDGGVRTGSGGVGGDGCGSGGGDGGGDLFDATMQMRHGYVDGLDAQCSGRVGVEVTTDGSNTSSGSSSSTCRSGGSGGGVRRSLVSHIPEVSTSVQENIPLKAPQASTLALPTSTASKSATTSSPRSTTASDKNSSNCRTYAVIHEPSVPQAADVGSVVAAQSASAAAASGGRGDVHGEAAGVHGAHNATGDRIDNSSSNSSSTVRGFMSRYSYRGPLPAPRGDVEDYEEGCWELPEGAQVSAVPYI